MLGQGLQRKSIVSLERTDFELKNQFFLVFVFLIERHDDMDETEKNRLEELLKIHSTIELKKSQLKNLRDNLILIRGPQLSKDGGIRQQGFNKDFTDDVDYFIDMEERILKSIEELVLQEEEMVQRIERLREPLHIDILRCRYMDGLSFSEIAKKLFYSESHIKREHQIAVEKYKKLD